MTVEEILQNVNQRQDSFMMMINYLCLIDNPLIVETGCVRSLHDWGAGYSTVLFDAFINEHGSGEFHSVDITEKNVEFARTLVSDKTKVHCADSVDFLEYHARMWADQNRRIDLLYLDSYDYNPGEEHESSLHHIFELLAAQPAVKTGTMIAVDDNLGDRGKGLYVKQYFEKLDIPLEHNGYQWIWIMP